MSTRLFDTNDVNNEFASSNDFKSSLIFPSDLTDANFFPEAIKFSIYDREGISFKELVNKSSIAFEAKKKELKAVENERISTNEKIARAAAEVGDEKSEAIANGEITDANQRLNNNTAILGQAALSGAGAGLTEAINQKRNPESPTERHIQSIYLQMPPTVSFTEGVEWQGSDLGVIGGSMTGDIASALSSGGVSSVGSILGGAAGGLTDKLFGGSGLIGATLGVLGGSGTIQDTIESTFNVKANPYKEQTFQGVGFRPFDFSFVLRARNQTESLTIREIVNAFRAYSKPSFAESGKAGVFAYPKEFRIEFLTVNGGEYTTNEFIPQIKYCICTNVTTNFAGNGTWKSFAEGAPTDVQLALTFQETEIITQEDVMGETEVGRFKNEEGYF